MLWDATEICVWPSWAFLHFSFASLCAPFFIKQEEGVCRHNAQGHFCHTYGDTSVGAPIPKQAEFEDRSPPSPHLTQFKCLLRGMRRLTRRMGVLSPWFSGCALSFSVPVLCNVFQHFWKGFQIPCEGRELSHLHYGFLRSFVIILRC